jgi:acetamidase/formamidase
MPTNFARTAALSVSAVLAVLAAHAQQPTQTLLATPTTVAWGFYSAQAKPVLTIKSGDTVKIQTLSTCGPRQRLESLGVAPADIPAYVDDIYKNYPAADKGPGGHILTGPVAVDGAEPGDVLEIRIQKIDIDVAWACNSFGAGRVFLPNVFPYSHSRLIPLDRTKMIGHFAPGIDIPLHPFFGSMGIATASGGKYDSAPPWMHGGNMDNKELVAGTTIYLPVNSKGANFEVGDGHAGQGNGEVDITALETQLTGTFQFIVHKGDLNDPHRLVWPRAETPTQYITMGFDLDLKTATEMAIRNMITFLSEQNPDHPHISRDDAYALISVACDVDITQLVDTKSGVHVMCPKVLFTASSAASH